jgi:hypothetical protein
MQNIASTTTTATSTKVRVYYNLHRSCLSIQTRTARGWRVTRHTDAIALADARLVVSAAGRARVLREQRKNVHAYLVGTVVPAPSFPLPVAVTYNPYKLSTFATVDGLAPIHRATLLHVEGRRITATL